MEREGKIEKGERRRSSGILEKRGELFEMEADRIDWING
jgi:hypothetical protein